MENLKEFGSVNTQPMHESSQDEKLKKYRYFFPRRI